MIVYKGKRENGNTMVIIEDTTKPMHYGDFLPPRNDLADDFDWGNRSAGAAHLSLALCAHALADDQRAMRVYQDFKSVLARIDGDVWVIDHPDLIGIVKLIEEHHAQRAPQ